MITYLLLRTLVRLRRCWHRRFGHGEVLTHTQYSAQGRPLNPLGGDCYYCTRYRAALQDIGARPAYCPVCEKHYLWMEPEAGAFPDEPPWVRTVRSEEDYEDL